MEIENPQFACLFVPDFPVEAVVRVEPELREHALAVVDGTPPLVSVVACNELARRQGVEPGMTRVQAEGRAPRIALRRRSPIQESAAHAALLDCACAFSPRVEDNLAAPDTILLDISGLERLFGPPAKIARDLARRVADLGMEANVAVAANPDVALHAARGFLGITVISSGDEAERLGTLPVETLAGPAPDGPATEMLDTLARWGIRTFRALAALPETAVHERMGDAGVRWQQLARGEVVRPLVPSDPPLVFEEAVELEFPVTLLEPLSFVLNRMLEQLCARMSARALSSNELRLSLGLNHGISDSGTEDSDGSDPQSREGNFPPCLSKYGRDKGGTPNQSLQELTVRLPVPMLDAKVFLKLLQLELRSRPPAAPVEKVLLRAEPVQPRYTQRGLFMPASPEPEKLEVTLARMRRVVTGQVRANGVTGNGQGETEDVTVNSIGTPELLDTHRPDAFRMKKFVPPAAGGRRQRDSVAPASGQWSRAHPALAIDKMPTQQPLGRRYAGAAVRRFRPPIRVEVTVRNGRPVHIARNSQLAIQTSTPERPLATGNCINAAGPWIESGDWWNEEHWSREVWDVALEQDGTIIMYRLYRDTMECMWFVEALYD